MHGQQNINVRDFSLVRCGSMLFGDILKGVLS